MKLFHFSQSVQRFSLRKYAIGVASVLLSCMFLGTSVVAAEEIGNDGFSIIATKQDGLSAETISAVIESPLKEQIDAVSAESSDLIGEGITEEILGDVAANPEEEASLAHTDINIKIDDTTSTVLGVASEEESKTGADLFATSSNAEFKGVENSLALEIVPENTLKQDSGDEGRTTIASKTIESEIESLAKDEAFALSFSTESEGVVDSLVLETVSENKLKQKSIRTGRTALRSINSSNIIGDDYPENWKNKIDEVDPWGYYKSYCTSFVAHRLSKVNQFNVPRAMGNAGQWGETARQMGYRVDNVPMPGAVAFDSSGGYGHVAWVANVSGDSVTVEEYNYGRRYVYNTRTVSRTAFTGYIHFKDLSSSQVGNPSGPEESGDLPASGVYRFASRLGVKNEPKISSPDIAFYEIGEVVNYDRTLKADNHQWISYISHSGNRRYIAVKQLAAPAKPVVSGNIHIQNKNEREGVFEVVVRDASSNVGLKEVQIPVWSTNGGQDDLIWYKATRQGNGDYKTTINIANHKNDRGEYHIHLYYVVDNGQQVGVGGTTTTISEQSAPVGAPTGTITIQNKDDNLGSFDIVIRDVSHPKGVKEVRVPVWSDNNGQDDIVWYVAARQEDGTYKVSVKATNHKNSQGQYLIHMYYVQSDDQLSFAGSATTVVKSTIRPSIPNSGSYTFSKRSGIKNEAKVNSPDIAFYEVGERVNYDKVLFSDGRYWISYISFSGNRRYITIT